MLATLSFGWLGVVGFDISSRTPLRFKPHVKFIVKYIRIHVYEDLCISKRWLKCTSLSLPWNTTSHMLNLTFQLLKLFAEGGLPATTVQTLAHAAWQEGWGHDDQLAEKLKGVGNSGTQPGNALRDLLRVTKHLGMSTTQPYLVKVRAAGGGDREVAVFLPHKQVRWPGRLSSVC